MGLRTVGIAAVAAAALALSGAAWAQQKAPSSGGKSAAPAASSTKASKGSPTGGNCIEVRNAKGNCIHSKSGSDLTLKAAGKTK
jgi:hypothetical protein